MKKIIYFLIIFSSYSFSYSMMSIIDSYTIYHMFSGKKYCYSVGSKSLVSNKVDLDGIDDFHSDFYDWTSNLYALDNIGQTTYITFYSFLNFIPSIPNIDSSKNYFSKYSVLVTRISCPEPSDPLDCKKVDGQYSNLDGTCTDCSNFLSDSTVEGMANCACGAVGSSYNGQSFLGTTTFSENGYKYSQSEVKCADGNKGYVYYGKIPLDNNNSDNNSTSPDNNSTKPSDGNTTTPSDGNGTKDGNSTSPSDGNGTGSGKDYTKYLETIVEKLKRIDDDTDSLVTINSSIYNTFSTDLINHDIPTDTSGGNWNTYQESWNNLIDSINAVSTKVDEFQGLVQNGFSSPFTKSSPTTCPYTTSFVFGDVGSIPIDVDLCKLFSPLRSIFYYFFYAFFVFSLLVFHVKMFLRLV